MKLSVALLMFVAGALLLVMTLGLLPAVAIGLVVGSTEVAR